jgi:hypothetical protein
MKENGQIHSPAAAISPGKEPPVPIGKEVWKQWKRKIYLSLPGIELCPSSF